MNNPTLFPKKSNNNSSNSNKTITKNMVDLKIPIDSKFSMTTLNSSKTSMLKKVKLLSDKPCSLT